SHLDSSTVCRPHGRSTDDDGAIGVATDIVRCALARRKGSKGAGGSYPTADHGVELRGAQLLAVFGALVLASLPFHQLLLVIRPAANEVAARSYSCAYSTSTGTVPVARHPLQG